MSTKDEFPISLDSLPQDLRIRFFETYLTDPNDLQSLRQVSSLFRHEVDQQVGIKRPINFSDSSGHTIQQSRTHFLRSVILQHLNFEVYGQLDIQQIIYRPSRLRRCTTSGRIPRPFVHNILSTCSKLSSFTLSGILTPTVPTNLFQLAKESNKPINHSLPYLKTLQVLLQQGPASALEVTHTSQEILHSISAPNLTHLILKIDYRLCTVLHIFKTIVSIISFLQTHPTLVSIHISFVGKGIHIPVESESLNQECLSLYDNIKTLLISFKKSIQGGRFNRLEEFLLESNSDDLTAKDISDHFIQALESPPRGIVKNIGFKIKSYPNWDKTFRTIVSYHLTLTKVFIECTIVSSIDFASFGVCKNLTAFSIHDTKYSILDVDDIQQERGVVTLNNITQGLETLPQMSVFIVNGLILSRSDVDTLSKAPLKVLGLREVALRDATSERFVIPPRPVVGEGDAFLSGIPIPSLMAMLNNRSLEALLVDLDSTFVTSYNAGVNFEKARELLTGKFRSLIFNISDTEDDDFPYWKTSFLGFSVEFPFF